MQVKLGEKNFFNTRKEVRRFQRPKWPKFPRLSIVEFSARKSARKNPARQCSSLQCPVFQSAPNWTRPETMRFLTPVINFLIPYLFEFFKLFLHVYRWKLCRQKSEHQRLCPNIENLHRKRYSTQNFHDQSLNTNR